MLVLTVCIQPSYKNEAGTLQKETLWLFGQAPCACSAVVYKRKCSKQAEEAEENIGVLMELLWPALKLCIQETISYWQTTVDKLSNFLRNWFPKKINLMYAFFAVLSCKKSIRPLRLRGKIILLYPKPAICSYCLPLFPSCTLLSPFLWCSLSQPHAPWPTHPQLVYTISKDLQPY